MFVTGSQVVSGDADGCGQSCVHTIHGHLCYSNVLICQLGGNPVCVEAVWHFAWLPQINLWFICLETVNFPRWMFPKTICRTFWCLSIFSSARRSICKSCLSACVRVRVVVIICGWKLRSLLWHEQWGVGGEKSRKGDKRDRGRVREGEQLSGHICLTWTGGRRFLWTGSERASTRQREDGGLNQVVLWDPEMLFPINFYD